MSTIPSQLPNRNELAEQYRTQKADRDELEQESEKELNRLKTAYNTQKADLEDRFEKSIQNDKINHYDRLRDQKKNLEKEEKRIEDTHRQIVEGREADLRTQSIKVETDGRENLRGLQETNAAREEFERKRALDAEELVRTQHKNSAKSIMDQSNKQITGLQEDRAKALVEAKENHAQALDEMHAHYDELRNQVSSQYQTELKTTQGIAAKQLNDRKLTNALWIQNYSDRQNDPFYRMARFDSELTESPEHYTLRVKVPEYERHQFRVQVAGQGLQLAGVRTNNEKAEIEPGRWVTTSSHQNVTEQFALDHPIDSKQITMTTEGDWVEYTIPKFGRNHTMRDANDAKNIAREERAITHDLEFPQSLPKPTLPADGSGKGTLGS